MGATTFARIKREGSYEYVQVLENLRGAGLRCIRSVHLRRQKEMHLQVLGRAGRFHQVAPNLHAKEMQVDGRRYVVCFNPEEAAQDADDRQAIGAALEDKLRQGPGGLVGNRGFRCFLRVERGAVRIGPRKVEADAATTAS